MVYSNPQSKMENTCTGEVQTHQKESDIESLQIQKY